MAIVAKSTRTLPAPTATIGNGFEFLLSTGWFTQADLGSAGSPIDGGANSIANGGGDLQIFSDEAATIRLPIQIITFVTGGTPSALVWVRTNSYTAGDTITICKDDTQTSQPAVGAAFGRNAVWVDYKFVLHMDEVGTNGVFLDSTGNGHDTTLSQGVSLATTNDGHPFGGTWPDFTTAEALTIANSSGLADGNPHSLSIWCNVDVSSSTVGLIGSRGGSGSFIQMNANQRYSIVDNVNAIDGFIDGGARPVGVTTLVEQVAAGTVLTGYDNNVQQAIDTTSGNINGFVGTNDFRIGTYFTGGASNSMDGRCCEARLKTIDSGAAHRESEYLNQSDPDNFGTSSEWVLVGAAGVTGDIAFSLPAIGFTSTGSATLPQPTGDASFNINSVEFSATGSATLPQPVGNANFSVGAIDFSAAGSATLPSPSGDINFSLQPIEFSGTGAASLPYPVGSIAFDIESISFAGNGQATLPNPSGDIGFSIASIEFSGAGSATQPSAVGDISFDIASIEFNGTGSVSGFNLPQGSIITLKYTSNIITLPKTSNLIKL